jgi:GH15 family glucan-1,4-alpha-glucosidase
VEPRGEDLRTVARFSVAAGERVAFTLAWHPSTEPPPAAIDACAAVDATAAWWRAWARQSTYVGEWEEAVTRSLLTLKALTFAPTGGIVAAPTTSLPEQLGDGRNWDYRYCWLRDATFTLYALLTAGFRDEARAWRDWLLRAVAGHPSQLQIMYGVDGTRLLPEIELPWLPGYERSAPVRIGNAAVNQFQLDVFGEVMDALYVAGRVGLEPEQEAWDLQEALMGFLESRWGEEDEGIWEVRGPRRHFTHSKVMAWVAVDRAVKTIEATGVTGPLDRWRRLRQEIHADVCQRAWDAELGSFVQSYGSKRLDASLLLIPLVGFLPPDDYRVLGTLAAIEAELVRDGFVLRYAPDEDVDGLASGEAAFLACSFWLVDNLALVGRTGQARERFERLLALRNDVGLLAEEYDPRTGRLVGNYPQAFSHVALVNSASNLSRGVGPAEHRRRG